MKQLYVLALALSAAGVNAAELPASTLASTLYNPVNVMGLFAKPDNVVNAFHHALDPSAMTAVFVAGLQPATYLDMAKTMMTPGMLQSVMPYANPETYANWALAPVNYGLYEKAAGPFLSLGTYAKWSPVAWGAEAATAARAVADPAVYAAWLGLPVNPALWPTLATPMNPEAYTQWGAALVDPKTFGFLGGAISAVAALAHQVPK